MYLGSGMPKMNLKSAVGQPFGNFKLVLDAESNVFNLEPLDGLDALPHEAREFTQRTYCRQQGLHYTSRDFTPNRKST
jgi:hypothetical protein